MTAVTYERVEIHSLPDMQHVPLGFWEGRVKELKHPELKALFVLPDRNEAARFAAEKIIDIVKEKPDAAISLPSGRQGNDVLAHVVDIAKKRDISFANVHFFNLDEYFPIDPQAKESFRNNLRTHLFSPLGIPQEHIHEIAANPGSNGDQVAAAYETLIQARGIDLVLHAIGPGGHIGFNEPGADRNSATRLVKLSEKTIYRDHVLRNLATPTSAITQGIGTILGAKHIVFIAFSPDYKEDMKQALFGPVDEQNPSSLLRTVGQKVEAITTQEIAAQFPI